MPEVMVPLALIDWLATAALVIEIAPPVVIVPVTATSVDMLKHDEPIRCTVPVMLVPLLVRYPPIWTG